MAYRNPDDPLVAALPQQPNTTGSPALAGQSPSMTGQGPSVPVPETSSSALSSGGIGSVGSAPLSPNGTNESQDGAGESQMDLVKDRGKPLEAMQRWVNDAGTNNEVMQMAENSKAKGRKAIAADPEQTNLTAGRMADEQGLTADKKGEANVEAIKNMFGDQYANKVNQSVTAGVTSKKEGEKKKKKYRGLFADMTRQEISMFFWDFGGSLMANGEQGLRSVGVASTTAMGAHRGRRKEEAALAVDTEELKRKAGLEERGVAAEESRAASSARTAAMAGLSQGFTSPEDGYLRVPSYDPETNSITWEIAKDKQGDPVKGDPATGRDYSGEKVYLENFLTEAGWTKQQIADYFGKAKGSKARRQDLTDALMKRISDAGILDVDPITGKKLREFKEADIKKWVNRMLALESDPEDGALPANNQTKSTADYLNDAQTTG